MRDGTYMKGEGRKDTGESLVREGRVYWRDRSGEEMRAETNERQNNTYWEKGEKHGSGQEGEGSLKGNIDGA